MTPPVFFSSLENNKHVSPLGKFERLFDACEARRFFRPGDLVAVKVHFGELGNTAFLRPVLLRPLLERLRALKTRPFLTDTNTLYPGMRGNSVDHLHNAALNGFNYSTLGTPVIIADGLRGENTVETPVGSAHVSAAKLAADILHADAMLVVSHFKGHEVSGFGGTLKNLSMGCASRAGKLDMHSTTRPFVDEARCTACGRCAEHCASKAIRMETAARITEACTGCARCIAVCPEGAIQVDWNESSENTQMKMAEYAAATVRALGGRVACFNVLADMSPACDCYPGNDRPLLEDLGFLASLDPVALDQASYDLVRKHAGRDPFRETYPYVDPGIQLAHAERIGLGSARYELIAVP